MRPSANDFMSARFSTDDLPERGRLEFVREVIGRSVMRIDVAPLPGLPLRWEAAVHVVPGLSMVSGTNTGIRLERTGPLLADGSDDLVLTIQTAGVSTFSHCGREVTLTPGDAHLVSRAEAVSAAFPAASGMVSLTMPRTALALLVSDIDDAVMRPIAKGGETLRLLSSYLRELENGYALASPQLRRLVVEHIYALAALVVGSGRDAAEAAGGGAVRAARLHAVDQAIRAGFAHPAFSLRQVVRQLGLSPRYIQELLHESGVTFTERVLELRLQKAWAMLADRQYDRLKIIDLAYACGFNEVSYFNRCFRRRFGLSPTGLRFGDGAWAGSRK